MTINSPQHVPILAPAGVASALTHWGSADQQATYLKEFAGENVPQAGYIPPGSGFEVEASKEGE